jgi:hypothetical protein
MPPPPPPSTTAPKSSSTHPRPPPHQTPAMAHFNLSVRPDFDVCNLSFSEEIRDRIDFFESRSVIVWIGKNMPYTNTSHVMEAFMSRFGLEKSSIQVSCHHPTDFLVIILDQDVFEEVAGHHSFPHGQRQFRLRRWSPRNQATRAAMRYYVRLCLEGLPLHLWSNRFATAVLGRSCVLHFVEESSRRRESTEVFELLAWTTDPVAIPLRVWLTVLDVDRSGHASPRVVIHRLRPMEPRRGMVYEVLIHVLSMEDTRRIGPDGRPLFYPFHFNLGVQDTDQEVVPAPGSREQEAKLAFDPARNRVPARHSCSTEYWRPNRRSDGENNEDEASHGGRSSASQRRGMFQRLRWPADKGCARERSPRRERVEGSRQGGSLACSPSPAPR